MPSIDFGPALDTIKNGIISLRKTAGASALAQLETAAQNTTDQVKANLQNWTAQLANGDIDADDFKQLVTSQTSYLEIAALTQTGIAQIQLDQFKQGVINLIVKTLTALVP